MNESETKPKTKIKLKPFAIGSSITAVVILLLAVQTTVLNRLALAARSPAPLIVVLAAVILILCLLFLVPEPKKKESAYGGRPYEQKPELVEYIPVVAALTAGVLFIVGISLGAVYQTESRYIEATTRSEAAAPVYQPRAPFSVASTKIQSGFTDIGGLTNKKFLPLTGRYSAIVEPPTRMRGYPSIVEGTPTDGGEMEFRTCDFADSARRYGGYSHRNLDRLLVSKAGRLRASINRNDTYGFCDEVNGELTPMLVAPYTRPSGTFGDVRVPAGVAVYDGATSKVTLIGSVKSGEPTALEDGRKVTLPGSNYPISVAESQRDSTKSEDGFITRWLRDAGWEDTTGNAPPPVVDKDGNEIEVTSTDVDSGNRSEFVLRRDSDTYSADYVTPLTRSGGSTAISAVGVVSASTVTAGEFNPYTIHVLPKGEQRPPTRDTAEQIRLAFPNIGWAEGNRVQEITPVSPKMWAATIGLNTNSAYRVEIPSGGSGNKFCLETTSGEALGCATQGSPNRLDGAANTDGAPKKDTKPAEGEDAAPTGLKGATSSDLLDELERRLADPSGN